MPADPKDMCIAPKDWYEAENICAAAPKREKIAGVDAANISKAARCELASKEVASEVDADLKCEWTLKKTTYSPKLQRFVRVPSGLGKACAPVGINDTPIFPDWKGNNCKLQIEKWEQEQEKKAAKEAEKMAG